TPSPMPHAHQARRSRRRVWGRRTRVWGRRTRVWGRRTRVWGRRTRVWSGTGFAGHDEIAHDRLVDPVGEFLERATLAHLEAGTAEDLDQFAALGDVGVPRDADRPARAQYPRP